MDEVVDLQNKYHISSISDDDKSNGFVTTQFTRIQLNDLINCEAGLCVARKNNKLVGYVMSASWSYWAQWPIFVKMASELQDIKFNGLKLNRNITYQYGPVCIDKLERGSGVLEALFEYSRIKMSPKFQILITFINKTNSRSFIAHTKNLGLKVVHEFEYNNNQYYELAYDASCPLLSKRLPELK